MKPALLLLLILLPALAEPYFETFHIISDIGLSHVSEEVDIRLSNNSTRWMDTFNYTLSHDPGSVYAEVDGKKVVPRIISEGDTWTLDVDIGLAPYNTTRILFRFRADGLIQVLQDVRTFQFTFSPDHHTRDFQLRVVLPSGAILLEKKKAAQSQPVVFPEAAIRSDGRRVTVEWNLADFKDDRIFLINYELPATAAPPSGYTWLLLLPLFVIILALYSTRVAWTSTIQALDPDEKKVINEVKKRPGIPQKDLAELTGFNKVKIHRVIERLSNSSLVHVDKHSNRTRVYLSEKLEGSVNPINSLKLFLSNIKLNLSNK